MTISWRRIAAVIFTHGEEFFDKSELFEMVYWWVCDMFFLGILARALGAFAGSSTLATLIVVFFIAMRPTERIAVVMARLITDELSGRMFLATFATPISQVEWLLASVIVGFLQALLRICLGYTLVFLYFGINVFVVGHVVLAAIPFLMLSGWVMGIFASAVVYLSGKRYITQIRLISFTVMALCGVYAPIAALPTFLQPISWSLPATYIFAGLRAHATAGAVLWPFLLKNLALNGLYAFIAFMLLRWAIKRAKRYGLANLENK
jgi:ABC-2 type transport system permease protein